MPDPNRIRQIFVLYIAIMAPYDVSFYSEAKPTRIWLDTVWLIIEIFFYADLVLRFFVAYYVAEEGRWASTISETATNYAKGWFLLDFLASFPIAELFGGA